MTDHAYVVDPLSRQDIRTVAAAVRAVGQSPTGYFDIMGFLEFKMPELSPQFQLKILSLAELGDQLGVTHPDAFIIKLREDIYDKACDGDGFSRMTVAHELGHFVLHSESKLGFARKLADDSTKAFMNSEWQANCFAGELLVPWQDRNIVTDLGPWLTVDEYGVSNSAAECQYRVFSKACRRSASALW
jgi:Zn-dependent peptidase ImmA (M78 family)